MSTMPFEKNLPPELQAQFRTAKRRERLAQMLQAQALNSPQGQMVSGHYVAPSPVQGIAQMAQAWAGGRAEDRAEDAYSGATTEYRAQQAKAIEDYIKNRQGVDPGVNAPPMMQPQSPRDVVTKAMANPYTADIAMYDLQRMDKMDMADRPMSPEQEAQKLRIAQARGGSGGGYGLTPNFYQKDGKSFERIYNKDGSFVDREVPGQLLRMMAYDPNLKYNLAGAGEGGKIDAQLERAPEVAAAAADEAYATQSGKNKATIEGTPGIIEASGEITPVQQKLNAQKRVSGNLEQLSNYYDKLDRSGAAIDTEDSALSNLSASIRASAPGQMLGRTFGTEEQSIRNEINQMRPILLQEIRQASQMGARGLDSNRELDFYLQAATDPSRDIQSNKTALAVLEQAYGLGNSTPDPNLAAQLKQEFEGSGEQPLQSGNVLRFDAQGNLIQ